MKLRELTGVRWRSGRFVGTWNGQRITGIAIGLRFYWTRWYWIPIYSQFAPWSFWLCFGWSAQWEYGEYIEEPRNEP